MILLDARSPASGASGASDGAVSVATKKPGAMMALAIEGLDEYRRLRSEGPLGGIFHDRSTFIVARTAAEQAVLEQRSNILAAAGVKASFLGGAEARLRIPALTKETRIALEIPDEGHVIGYDVVDKLIRASCVKVLRDHPVTAMVPESDRRIRALRTPHGDLMADSVVIAAGLESNGLLGSPVLAPNKGQVVITQRTGRKTDLYFDGHILSAAYLESKGASEVAAIDRPKIGTSIDPLKTGQVLIGGSREGPGDPSANEFETIKMILLSAIDLCPGLASHRILRAFAGLRACSPDSLPLIGRHPSLENVWIATGFEGDGICLGPLTGRMIADLVLGGQPSISIQPFDPGRFSVLKCAA